MNKILNILKNFFVVILLFISFILINVYILLYNISQLVSKKNIVNVFKEVNMMEIFSNGYEDKIYQSFEEVGLSEEEAKTIIENDEFNALVGQYTSDILNGILEGEERPEIDEKKFSKDLKSVYDVVIENMDIKLTEEDRQEVYRSIDKYVPEIVLQINNSEELYELFGDNVNESLNMTEMKTIQWLYRNRIWFLISASIMLILVILLKLKDFKFIKSLSRIGIFYTIAFIIISKFISFFGNSISKDSNEFQFIFSSSIKTVSNTYFNIGIICLIISLTLIGIRYGIKNYNDKKQIENE